MRVLREKNIPHGDIQVVFTVAEEGGVYGSRNMNPDYLKAKYGYAMDGPGHPGRVILSAPGQFKIFAEFKGKKSHAGISPELGLNAIVIAAKAIAQVPDGRIDNETTCNVGMIQAGESTNIVPDRCLVTSEVRSRDYEKLEKLRDKIIDTFKRVAKENNSDVEIKTDRAYAPFKLKETDEVIRVALEAARNIGLDDVGVEDGGGGSDANHINGFGIPVPAMACGIFGAHTLEEYTPESELYETAEWCVEIVKVVAKGN
ncbi:hypothetical protein RsTz2092_10590 [Deferribacterales bacterium RsTz2092]